LTDNIIVHVSVILMAYDYKLSDKKQCDGFLRVLTSCEMLNIPSMYQSQNFDVYLSWGGSTFI